MTHTPWGPSQSAKHHARGIVEYSCAGHGGFHVSKTLNVKVHEAWRAKDGWYEEDCDWAIVALTFPEHFSAEDVAHATSSAKNWNPDGYTAFTGVAVALEESCVLRSRAFRAEHAKDLVTVCAFGSWHKNVPAGQVGVAACEGGRLENGQYGGELRYFLVPAEEYRAGSGFGDGFVVDLARHPEVPALDGKAYSDSLARAAS